MIDHTQIVKSHLQLVLRQLNAKDIGQVQHRGVRWLASNIQGDCEIIV